MPKKGWKELDSQAADEAARYDNPIPSRLFIMETLEKRGAPASHKLLCRELGVTLPEQQEALLFRLKAMIRDGQLLETRKGTYGLLSKMDLIKGRIQGNKDGYGFLIPDEGGEDYYLSWREMRKAFDGDRAVIRETGVDRRGRLEGQIVEVIERNTTQLVGRFYIENDNAFVVPENSRIGREILIKPGPLMPSHGQYVLVEILEQPGRRVQPLGLIKEVLGERQDAGMEVDVALRTHDIPHEWPPEVEEQVARFKPEVAERDKKHRVDLRETPFVTIDGEDARDFDDAVYCEPKKSGGWRLFVAIADVSHYVKPGTALDKEAYNRGTSVYFPGHVIPMLPEVLSNGLCSLNPEVDRLAMLCEMTISGNGKISGYKFYEGLIRSHARLTYTQVWEMLSKPLSDEGKALRRERKAVLPHVEELYNLFKVLKSIRSDRGTIDFETVETQIVFGRNRKIEKIVPAVRNDAHKLIEECMLCANVCAAKFLQKHKIPGLYRVHEGPTMEKRLNLNSFIASLGLSLPAGKLKPAHFQALLASVKDRPDYNVIQTVVLRSMSQAVYTSDNQGHFGLAFDEYAHFTSPIRRYPDLLVHRAIRHIIRSSVETRHVVRVGAREMNKKTIYPYDGSEVLAMGEHCSATERRADEATRDAMDWLKCEYMQQHIGQTYSGVISSVTGFGLFVALDDIYVEGLVHVTSLPDDYYHYDAVHHRMVGERTGRSYRLGDDIEVMVASVNLDDQKIDFELSTGTAQRPSRSRKSRKSPSKGGKPLTSVAKSRAAKRALLDAAKSEESGKKTTGKKKKPTRKQKTRAKSTGKKSGKSSAGKKPETNKKSSAKPADRQPRKRKAK
ncbi:ribonuclease R [Endozoicomonas sp. ALD040]|uniref:ribonuclease R n=1 Tax=Endozoicomonas sp. ALD040 TaxID=3403079 RepID=UPI003BB1FBD2